MAPTASESHKRCNEKRRHSAPDLPHEDIVARRRNPRTAHHSSPKPIRLEPIKGSRATPENKSTSASPRSSCKTTTKVAIPRKAFAVVYALFKDYDRDGDGLISLEEFSAAVGRQHYDSAPFGKQPQILTHAEAIYESIMRREKIRPAGIRLVQFVSLYFPHLSRADVERAVRKYTYKPPLPPPKETTLEDVEGAKEEIEGIFTSLDTDHDGLVRVASLEPMFERTGLGDTTIHEWLRNLGLQGSSEEPQQLERLKSKLNLGDLEELLAPVYIDSAKEKMSYMTAREIQRRLDFNSELKLSVLYE